MRHSIIKEMYDNLLDLNIDANAQQRRELLNKIYSENDFYWEVGDAEYRIICEDVIQDIHTKEIKEMTDIDLDKYWWIAIDWENTAENVRKSDGYGNHFSHYDGSEQEFRLDRVWYYVFRVA